MKSFLIKNNFFIISIGAIPAAILRWRIDQIFIANIFGCFLLGFINSLPINRRYKLIFGFGFCGTLTTYSGWSNQLYELINQGFYKLFFFNSILLVVLAVLAVCLGHFVANTLRS